MRRRIALLSLLLVTPAARAAAQDHDHAHGTEGLGRVTFPVSCSAAAGQRFEHAMAVLHSFWWEEGPRAFNAVLQSDSSCAMAHWGLAMNAWGNPFAGGPGAEGLRAAAQAAERAAQLGGKTPREAGFIAAVGALYRNAATTSNAARLQAYADTMARVYRDFPSDDEVQIFYALSLVATAARTDTTFEKQKRAAAILNPLFAKHPDHPGLAHYIIHANDSPYLASLGLDAARRYADIAPAAPHAQHMPSHIFIRLGMWDETIASNQKSYDAGVAYAKAEKMSGVNYHEFHALDYMVYGYLQRGQDKLARSTAAFAETLSTVRAPSPLLGGYNRLAMRLRIPLERGDWAAAAAVPLNPSEEAPVVAALTRFTRAIGAARSGSAGQAEAEVKALDSLATVLESRQDAYWSRVVRIKSDAAKAWVLFMKGDSAGGLALAKAAADREDVTEKHPVTPGELLPARELEADMHLAAGHAAAALAAYKATLKREPHRARSVFGSAVAAERAGDRAATIASYREFLALMEKGDGDRREVALARRATARP